MTHPVRLILSYQGVFDVDKWVFCGVFYVGKWVFATIIGEFANIPAWRAGKDQMLSAESGILVDWFAEVWHGVDSDIGG